METAYEGGKNEVVCSAEPTKNTNELSDIKEQEDMEEETLSFFQPVNGDILDDTNIGTGTEKEEEEDEDGPTSSIGNVIPYEKLRNGWFKIKTFLVDKADELSKSETVQKAKETVTPYLEKAKDTVTPVWEKAKETATPYFEKAKEKTSEASVYMSEKKHQVGVYVQENLKPQAEAHWQYVSTQAEIAAVKTAESIQKITAKLAVVVNDVGGGTRASSEQVAETLTI